MRKSYLIAIHLLYWVLFCFTQFSSIIVFGRKEVARSFNFVLNITFIIVNILAFYFNYFVILPKVIRKRKSINFIIGVLMSFCFFITARYFVEEIVLRWIYGRGNYNEETAISFYFYDNLFYGSNAVFMSSLIWFLNYSFKISKENNKLIEEKNKAEISLLKSQINPHFIFNTLNNIYSLVNQKSNKSLNAIEKLGDLLRFSGTEINKDFTSLSSEIQYIRNYIDLESLRIDNPENILLEDKTENTNLKISPMLLIPFVENAFKHGNLKDFPLNILIETKKNQLHFYQKNKISIQEKDKSSGIGIDNVKKRLSIVYPEKHSLEISNQNGFYEVNLNVELD